MSYKGFGYMADSCPLSKDEMARAAFRLKCNEDENGRSQYFCVPNENLTAVVEFCYTKTVVGFFQKGNCLKTIRNGFLHHISCKTFTEGCPTEDYIGTDLYKYPACSRLNAEDRCFVADPLCNAPESALGVLKTTPYFTKVYPALIGVFLPPLTLIGILFICFVISRSQQSQDLTNEEVAVLFCFLCADSGSPDFSVKEWLDILNEIRKKAYKSHNPVTSKGVQQTLNKLRSLKLIISEHAERDYIRSEAANETMCRISLVCIPILFYLSSYNTASRYLRSQGYQRKPEEICIISSDSDCDSLLIQRLQMDILTHVTLEDREILKEVSNTLKIPYSILEAKQDKRDEFLQDLTRNGEPIYYTGQSQDIDHQVKWLWRNGKFASPDIVRSSIGGYPHCDIFITGNIAYRKQSKYLRFTPQIKSLLFSLLFVDNFSLNVAENSHKNVIRKIREEYFSEIEDFEDVSLHNLPNDIKTQDCILTFASETVQHDAMYAFITECLVVQSNLDFFLRMATQQLISEYCRSYWYKAEEKERILCLHRENYNSLIDRLKLEILKYSPDNDEDIQVWISARLKVPIEILMWDQEARKRYVEYANRGTETVHDARGMIVGCAGAGKTTLLKRLLRCSEAEIRSVKSTVGLEVHEEAFEICNGVLKVLKKNDNADPVTDDGNGSHETGAEDNYPRRLTFFDFGGQCAYYACHQIYLTRRAFYILVIDASKPLDKTVDKEVCDQDGTLFSSWTYADYFAFWIKSILTFCSLEVEKKPDILFVATHWEGNEYENNTYSFMQTIGSNLPNMMSLQHYIPRENCFFTHFPLSPLKELEKQIISCASDSRWSENVPKEWLCLELEILTLRQSKRILEFQYILSKMPGKAKQSAEDMLRFYHDAGKVLYFNEQGLNDIVIIDVQWFVDAFKNIITDSLHTCWISKTNEDWKLYYQTGHLKDALLTEIWRLKDNELMQSLENKRKGTSDLLKDPRCIMFHKKNVLTVMQRLGLMAVGKTSHYVPCMNRRTLPLNIKNVVENAPKKAPIMIFLFDFLPYFLYFRLIVGCMQITDWRVLDDGKSLYKNASFFEFTNHFIVVSVTDISIMVHIYHPLQKLEPSRTLQIKRDIKNTLQSITESFHKKLIFKTGFSCQKYKKIGEEVNNDFIEESVLMKNGIGRKLVCPRHQLEGYHEIELEEYNKYWKE